MSASESNIKIAKASIVVRNPEDATSYTVKSGWKDPESGIVLTMVFNVNADVTVEKFHSKGAPQERTLDLKYTSISQARGFQEFRGTVGGGIIDIRLEKGVVIHGNIEGGPEAGQSFVGSGSWTRS